MSKDTPKRNDPCPCGSGKLYKHCCKPGRLEADGIPAVVMGAELAATHWLLSNAVGGVKLCVRAEDVDDALAVLDWDEDVVEPEARCPECGSGDVRYEKYNLRRTYLAIMLKVPMRVKKECWTCKCCGATWKDEEAGE